jgi:hypothetical protein
MAMSDGVGSGGGTGGGGVDRPAEWYVLPPHGLHATGGGGSHGSTGYAYPRCRHCHQAKARVTDACRNCGAGGDGGGPGGGAGGAGR